MEIATLVGKYHFEGRRRGRDRARAATFSESEASEWVFLELLVGPLKKGWQDVADEIELALLHFPNLTLAPVTRDVLLHAAEIRARYGLRIPDAIMLGTAALSGATLAVTNDGAWGKVQEIEVLLLRELKP